MDPDSIENLLADLPDPDSARRFFFELNERCPKEVKRAGESLVSDLLTLAAYSPLLSTTILQNPQYIAWLGRERTDIKVRSKEELLESLSRFSLLHTDLASNVMLARFRRRELLRTYLRDIRGLATVAEVTEELSNLADAVIEFALKLAAQDLENRFGVPLATDARGRSTTARFCVVALGKLGSRELNYSSDIDLLFIYSSEGSTSDTGSLGRLTNREYFIKLSEKIISVAGGQSGEGAAYRIDMRLRPHGSIGRLALSLEETARYYETEAREWEQQVLIRSRAVAGDVDLFKELFAKAERFVFRADADAATALENVRLSKRRIEEPTPAGPGFNVKLGRGGIREIEFIAQALQLAHGGNDRWLRYPHTLVSLARLADRGFISEKQLTALYEAYDFLRRLEHRLQMEHGLQTHTIPRNQGSHLVAARRMGFSTTGQLDRELKRRTDEVRLVFESVFGEPPELPAAELEPQTETDGEIVRSRRQEICDRVAAVSPHFAQMAAAIPDIGRADNRPYASAFNDALAGTDTFSQRLAVLRRSWSRMLLGIVLSEIDEEISMFESKKLQTKLAEASVNAALAVMRDEMAAKFGENDVALSVLALGKLGGGGVDYGSDLDIVLVYQDQPDRAKRTAAEVYGRAVEIFVTTLSGMTRDGNLYRVDLRLRPYGRNGASSNPRSAFIDYFRNTAAVWELLAFVKLRGVAGEMAADVENEVREIIHARALETGADQLRAETLRIRNLLERQKSGRQPGADIKYGPGGMLDIYFATRYLQLRDNVPDRPDNRSTVSVLEMLWENGSLSEADHEAFAAGYAFLSELDHNIRLVTGRSRRVPSAQPLLEIIANKMRSSGVDSLRESLVVHQLNVRSAYDHVLAAPRP